MAFEASQIGELAGIIWRTLESKGKLNFEGLQELTNLDTIEVAAAIGWLAREGKVGFVKENGVTYILLYQERYY